jgi:RNA polymerase sigma-70 factor (ECF subfamily)
MDAFLRSVERRAFIVAKMATNNDEEALDIVQDAMFKLVEKYSHLTYQEWGGYFYRILHNKINDWYRREKVRRRWRVFFNHKLEGDFIDPENMVPQVAVREPEQFVFGSEISTEMLNAIEQLPLRQQQAVTLRIWEGFSVAETASIMGCSEGSVKTHLSRAVHRLRSVLVDSYHGLAL